MRCSGRTARLATCETPCGSVTVPPKVGSRWPPGPRGDAGAILQAITAVMIEGEHLERAWLDRRWIPACCLGSVP
jgi:hypothetical protein